MKHHRFVALLLALNYLSFQVEVFEEEYEANHKQPTGTCAIGAPWVSWESFDKTNAPKAFVVDPQIRTEFLFLLTALPQSILPPEKPFTPVRDKSPPEPAGS